MNEAQKTASLLKLFQYASREDQDKVIRGFELEGNKPCPACGRQE